MMFSDGVMAIAITLLALEIRLPGNGAADLSDPQLLTALRTIAPQYIGYIISFLVIGLSWMGHHRNFRMIKRYDTRLMFLNILYLMSIAFIPFPTRVLIENGNLVSTVFYALSMVVVGLLSSLLFFYAFHNNRLTGPLMDENVIHRRQLQSLLTPGVFLLSAGIAFINTDLAKYSWTLLTLLVYTLR